MEDKSTTRMQAKWSKSPVWSDYNNSLDQSNLSLAESKLPNDLKIKWGEHSKCLESRQPSLTELSLWLKDQAGKSLVKPPAHPNHHGKIKSSDVATSKDYTLIESTNTSRKAKAVLCILGDGQQHKNISYQTVPSSIWISQWWTPTDWKWCRRVNCSSWITDWP